MKNYLLFTFCIALIFKAGVAQKKDLSFLKTELARAISIQNKIDILNDYADTLCLYRVDTGKVLAVNALQLSLQNNYYKGYGEASHSLGLVYFRRNNDSALYYFHQSHNAYLKQSPSFSKMALTLNNLSRTHLELLQYDSSAYWAKQATNFSKNEKAPDNIKSIWLMYSYGALGNAYEGLAKYDSANIYLLKAIQFSEENGSEKMLAIYLKGLSFIQAKMNNYPKAISFCHKAIEHTKEDERAVTFLLANLGDYYSKINNFPKAKAMADSSLNLGNKTNVYNVIGKNYATLAFINMQQNRNSEALHYLKKGLTEAKKYANSKSAISDLYRKLGEVYEKMDSLSLAEANYLQALQMADSDEVFKRETNLLLAKFAYKKGDYLNAFIYLQDYQKFYKEAFNKEKLETIQELNIRYETVKKDQQLLLLSKERELQRQIVFNQLQQIEKNLVAKKEQELKVTNLKLEDEKKEQLLHLQQLELENTNGKQKEQSLLLQNTQEKFEAEKKEKELNSSIIKNQRNWFIYLIASFLIISLLALLLFNRYKLVKTIQSQNLLLNQRQRISQDLHDEVGATLSGISMYSHILKGQVNAENSLGIQNTLTIIQQNSLQMVDKLNDIVWLNNPQKDSVQQLFQRLEDYLKKMGALKNMRTVIQIPEFLKFISLPEESRRHIYLFCKEAIINAIKYSGATELCFLVAEPERQKLHITISDNGSGFNQKINQSGNGLLNMAQRAEAMQAKMQIISAVNSGTTVALIVKME